MTAPGAVEANEKFLVKLFTKSLRVAGQRPAALRAAQPREKRVGALSYQPVGL